MYGEKLRQLRNIEGWTQEQVAKKIGVSKQTYSHYENEKRTPSLKMIKKLAQVYGVDLDQVFGGEDTQSREVREPQTFYEVPNFQSLPIVGQIACGNGQFAYEDVEGYEDVPRSWLGGADHFFLRAKGDSMINARIHEDDLLLIRRQDEVENGEIAAVMINGEAVLKRVYKTSDSLILQSENPKYPPLVVPPYKDVKIIGKLKRVVIKY